MGAPLPANEAERLAALRALNILDTPPEERFDRITRIAQRLFDVPIALVSLVDINRQWFKSCQGLPMAETPRSMSFCAYALERTDPLVVPDTRLDPRFVDNPLVTHAPAIRFYAGQPLAGPDGYVVGTLCILDCRPRQMTPSDLKALTDLAHWAVNELNTVELSQAYVIKHESEARIRAVLQNVAEGVITFDAHARIESFNPAAERIFSSRASDVIGAEGAVLFAASDWAALHDVLALDSTGARPADGGRRYEVSGRRKDGDLFPVELAISSFDLNEQRLSILIARDMSERKRAHEELERRAGVLREQAELLDLAHDTIMVRGMDGTIRYWNRGAGEMYGWTSADAVGKVSHRLLRTRFPKSRLAIERDLLRTGRWEGELVHTRRDGQRIIVASRWVMQRDKDGAPIAVLEINNDVTERKRAEERLQATLVDAQALYRDAERAHGESRAILDATDEAIILIGSDRRLVAANRRFAALFGVEPGAVTGRPVGELHDLFEKVFVDPADVRAQLARSSDDAAQQFTTVVAQRWPERRELQIFSAPVQGAENEPLGRLYAFRDVTHEREVDRMKSEFVSLVSHELRTPLTSIKGFVDLILDGDVGEIGEEQRELLQIVKNNADRLVALINDLLDVSRIESGKIELQRAPQDLGRLIGDVVVNLRAACAARHQTLTVDVPMDLPPVLADADRVTQILTNLLSNAHKYTPDGGSIRVTAELRDNAVRVAVRDSGIGLTPDERTQLFTKFFRAQNATTRAIGGTGLGLAITRSLVEMHGGEMGVASAVGEGSTFSFTLPVAVAAAVPTSPVHAEPTGGLVLVVDDEPDIATLIRRYLERAGFRVLIAHDATQARTIAKAEHPDLITLDVMLPGTDGFTLLEWLKGDVETAAIPVVMLSITDDGGRGKLLGAVDYLRKPVDEHVLLEHVRAILADSRARPILVADDDPDIRALLVELLHRAGYEVLEASDGAQAAALARQHQPSLALLDIRMPGTDGIAALRALRSDAATRDMPVVMMTASPGMLEASRSMIEALGGAARDSKPLTAPELAVAISNGFAGREEGKPAGVRAEGHRTATTGGADRGGAGEP